MKVDTHPNTQATAEQIKKFGVARSLRRLKERTSFFKGVYLRQSDCIQANCTKERAENPFYYL